MPHIEIGEYRLIQADTTINLSKLWTTYMPILAKIVAITNGSILELGTGFFSTPYLHWACYPTKRKLVSYENSSFYAHIASQYTDSFHDIYVTGSYEEIDIEKEWDVVFIDFFEVQDRQKLLERLLKYAKYVVIHDSTPEDYVGISNYRLDYTEIIPGTSVFSNSVDVSKLEL